MRISARAALGLLAVFAIGCGARDPAADPESAPPAHEPALNEPPDDDGETPTEETEPSPPEPQPDPEPAPIVIEAGAQLGPIRVGMSEEEVRALGLEESEVDSRSRRFGVYRVFFGGDGVRRIEAALGDLGRVRYGDQIFGSDTHIHQFRDVFEGCVWTEGGGERYRCADGTLFIQTTHSMAPARYTIAVSE